MILKEYIGYNLFNNNSTAFNLIESIWRNKYPDKPIYIVHPHEKLVKLDFTMRNYNYTKQ